MFTDDKFRTGFCAVVFNFTLLWSQAGMAWGDLSPEHATAVCKVIDPELQGSYEGGCRNGLASGYGVAKGSAESQGQFVRGLKERKGGKTRARGAR